MKRHKKCVTGIAVSKTPPNNNKAWKTIPRISDSSKY